MFVEIFIMAKYWIATISKDHICKGIEGNFIQVCHGKKRPLQRMSKGDRLLVYSSKTSMTGKDKLQKFTAVGEVIDDDVYSFKISDNFIPFRRNMNFFTCREISIIPLIEKLTFITNKKSWGYPFRFGILEINKQDYDLISSNMLLNE